MPSKYVHNMTTASEAISDEVVEGVLIAVVGEFAGHEFHCLRCTQMNLTIFMKMYFPFTPNLFPWMWKILKSQISNPKFPRIWKSLKLCSIRLYVWLGNVWKK